MFETDKADFRDIMMATMDVYSKDVSKEVLRLWFAALEPYSLAEVRAGFSRYIKSTESGSFPPKPADIIRMIEGSSSDRGMIAWATVHEAIVRVGSYRSVCFDDPIIHLCIEAMGGWVTLCGMSTEDMPFRAADFAKRYRGYAERGAPADFPAYLVGISEASNGMHGFKCDPPAMVGDQAKAALVMEKGSAAPRLKITLGDLAKEAVKQITHRPQ